MPAQTEEEQGANVNDHALCDLKGDATEIQTSHAIRMPKPSGGVWGEGSSDAGRWSINEGATR